MVMKIQRDVTIEDPRNHPAGTVDTLRQLLAGGSHVQADPKRPGFYEIEHEGVVFYIHISPVSGKILLLATWDKALEAVMAEADHLAA